MSSLLGWIGLKWFLVCLGLSLLLGCQAPEPARSPQAGPSTPVSSNSPTAAVSPIGLATDRKIGFKDRRHWMDHFEKHGQEFASDGISTPEQYLELAQNLRDAPVGEDILESVRKDGVITRFQRSRGTFLACHSNKVIRTCFKPRDGESYFRRQAKRPHD